MTERHWHPARLDAVDEHALTLWFTRPEHCQRCQAGQGCGAGLFAQLLTVGQLKAVTVAREQVETALTLQPGQWVRVGVSSQDLTRSALWMYGAPLLAFMAVLWALPRAWPEALSLVLALLAGVAMLSWGRRRSRSGLHLCIAALNSAAVEPNV